MRYISYVAAMLFIATSTIILLAACSRSYTDSPDEDYASLFPFTGIDKPSPSKNGIIQRPCDPSLSATDYQYPGIEEESPEHIYNITLTVMFNEVDMLGLSVEPSTSRYFVHYVDANKEYATVVCHKNDMALRHLGIYSDSIISVPETRYTFTLENGVERTVKFTVRSGHPLYLCVDGEGPTNSTIKASIKAESTDGLITVPELGTEQTQNEIGAGRVKNPYCQTIILP